MSAEDCSAAVREFVRDYINSVAELELVLLLWRGSARDWGAPEVARALFVEPAWTERQLEALRQQGLVTRTGARYQFAQASPELDQTLDELARTYAERRVSLITLIYSKPRDHIRSFANAFRLRRNT